MAQVIWNTDIDVYDPDVMPVTVARAISRHLSVHDLLSFEQVSRNTHRVVSNPDLWVAHFRAMGLWDRPKSEEARTIDKSVLENPLKCLNHIVRDKKKAKYQLIKITKTLGPYYTELLLNMSFTRLKMFKDFQTPEEQAQILKNLLTYNKIDKESREDVYEKLIAIFEIFENALLRELDIHFEIKDYERTRRFILILADLNNQQTLIDFFLQKSIFDNDDSDLFNLDRFDPEAFFTSKKPALPTQTPIENEWADERNDEDSEKKDLEGQIDLENLEDRVTICTERFDDLINQLLSIFNKEAKIIDAIFPPTIPMMYKVSEELITNQLNELLALLFECARKHNLHLQVIPYVYLRIGTDFVGGLDPCANIGESYQHLVMELFDMLFESFAVEYMRDEIQNFKANNIIKVAEWNKTLTKREAETTEEILKHTKIETKDDFLSSFKKIFAANEEDLLDIQIKAKILSENIKSLNKTLNPELVLSTLNDARTTIERLYRFNAFTIHTVRNDIYQAIQDVYINVLELIGDEHIKNGFEKAVTYLQSFNPNSPTFTKNNTESISKPIKLFFELINIGDLIIQMLDIFYKEELLNRKIIKLENSILNPSLQHKKKLESMIDKYVADGLNVGLEVLVSEIESIYEEYPPTEYLSGTSVFGTTNTAQKALQVLEENIDLLVDCADKSIVDVFQQELSERFFQIIVKLLKKSTISVNGAPSLISDLNLYYEFILEHIKTNKKMVLPLYQSLKQVGNIYLISGSDAKAIGKLVSDLSKFNGIFGQEEIYEFVQRRQDWPQIRKHVEKVMYGFGIADCKMA